MVKPQTRLPPSISDRAFSVAEAVTLGVSREVLRHKRFLTPFHGVHRQIESSQVSPGFPAAHASRVRAFAVALRPGEMFSHTTALLLYGCPLSFPRSVDPLLLHTTGPRTMSQRRAAGVRGHQSELALARCVFTSEAGTQFEVAAPRIALAQAASMCSVKELVAASNHLVQRELARQNLRFDVPAGERERVLQECLSQFDDDPEIGKMKAGRPRLRRALELTTSGAESRMETLTWLMLVAFELEAYFEQQVVLEDEAGEIGRFDLVCKRLRVIVEYDGEQHRTDRGQYLKDLKRLERAQRVGFAVIRVTSGDVFERRLQTVARIAGALGVRVPSAPKHAGLL